MSEEISLFDLIKDFKEENKKDHERIEEQTKKTNGSVKDLQLWRERIIGMFIGATTLISVLAFILGGLVFPAIIKAIK